GKRAGIHRPGSPGPPLCRGTALASVSWTTGSGSADATPRPPSRSAGRNLPRAGGCQRDEYAREAAAAAIRTAGPARSARTRAVGPVTDTAATTPPSGPKIGAPTQL